MNDLPPNQTPPATLIGEKCRRQVPLWIPCLIVGLLVGAALILKAAMPEVFVLALVVVPTGLVIMTTPAMSLNPDGPIRAFAGAFLLVSAYAIYPVLLLAMFRTRRWVGFGIVCLLLLGVLLLNVVGCHKMLEEFSRIQ